MASSADPRENVLVIDDGFDPGSPALAGRVAAQHTVVCAQGEEPLEFLPERDGGAPLEPRKAALLSLLRTRDERCRLRAGIDAEPDPLADISTYRPAWNRLVENDVPAESVFTPAQLQAIGRGRFLARGRFHGTATAGLIAHANPGVRLVLVEIPLGPDDDDMKALPCPDQRELDDLQALFADPEVRTAYVQRPPARLDEELNALRVAHRIGLVNESFGFVSRETVEDVLASVGCPRVDLRPYFALRGSLEEERARAHPPAEALLAQAAGNDGSEVHGAGDLFECAGRGSPRLLVGAYDLAGLPSSFSNHGACVDVSAPGENVIAHLPGGWLMPLDGTSFSAPLLLRLVSLDRAGGPFTAAGARAALLAARDDRARIPLARFPRELFYDPERLTATWALTRAGSPPAPRARPGRRALEEVFSLLRLGRVGGR